MEQANSNCLVEAKFENLPGFTGGKVRDSYKLPGRRRLIVTTDRQSAFDQVLAAVPYKGQVLNQTARFWFDRTKDICANHILSYPDPNVILARHLDMIPIEMVVRSYLTGSTETSIWPMYNRGERQLYGHQFPDGMRKNQKLPTNIVTPAIKPSLDSDGHDVQTTTSEILAKHIVTEEQWAKLVDISLRLFARGQKVSAENGLILVDTKYEFGFDENRDIVVADEIHTPDSSRYWIAKSYEDRFANGEEPESLDKEFLRLWIASQCDPYNDLIPEIPPHTLEVFSRKYIELFERVTGSVFEKPDPSISVKRRIQNALELELPEYFNK